MLFRHSTPISLRFSDMDAFRHINNANYLTYIEEARIKYFNDIVFWNYDWSANGIILARVEIDYRLPGYFKDTIEVRTRCTKIGNKSITLEYEVVKISDKGEFVIASALTILVMYNYESEKSILVPDEWKMAIRKYEGIDLD